MIASTVEKKTSDRKSASPNSPKYSKTIRVVSLKIVRENGFKYDSSVCGNWNVREICTPILEQSAIERVVIIGLDTANKPTVLHITNGTVDQSPVFPATIMKILLLSNCRSFIIAHNHPAASFKPSEADWKITGVLKEAGKLFDISLLDHCIFTPDMECLSMRNDSRWKE